MEITVVHNKSVHNKFFYVIHFSPILYSVTSFLSKAVNEKVTHGVCTRIDRSIFIFLMHRGQRGQSGPKTTH